MSECTAPRIVMAAKNHRCSWCPETIDKGSSHVVYTWFNNGAFKIRMHPECWDASKRWMDASGENEWTDNNNTRGCTCEAGDPGHGTHPQCVVFKQEQQP